MARPTKVPVTPAVVEWAIEESGHSLAELAIKLGVSPQTLRAWLSGKDRPSLTEFHRLANTLKRSEASFFLPKPPKGQRLSVQFRHPPDSGRTDLSPVELVYLREASRLQRTVSWALKEMGHAPIDLPRVEIDSNAEETAVDTRERVVISTQQQLEWRSSTHALNAWRSALEDSGVLVFLLPMGREACRGFSLWDRYAPLIAANTWWNNEARSFTLFHEYGHLLTRTASVCSNGKPALRTGADPAERWCERFAAAVLLPWADVRRHLRAKGWVPGETITDLSIASVVARRFKASLRATVLRLIDKGVATWDLYDQIPPYVDDKPQGGGGEGRNRREIREDEYGKRTHNVLLRAVDRDVLTRNDVIGLLDVTDSDLDALRHTSGA